MKYGKHMTSDDISYGRLKLHVNDKTETFLKVLYSELVSWEAKSVKDSIAISDISKNFLACIKLAKKHEKVTESTLDDKLYDLLHKIGAFSQNWGLLRTQYDRKYPQYSLQTLQDESQYSSASIIAHKAFEPYQALNMKDFKFRYKCDYVEIDVVLCKSGEILLMHDQYHDDGRPIDRCDLTDLPDCVTLRDLIRQFPWDADYPNLMIDIKGFGRVYQTMSEIHRLLDEYHFPTHRVLLASFNERYIAESFRINPEYPRALISGGRKMNDDLEFLEQFDIDIYICDENLCCDEMITQNWIHNIKTWVYTVNNQGRLDYILKMGIAGIITDFPNLIQQNRKP